MRYLIIAIVLLASGGIAGYSLATITQTNIIKVSACVSPLKVNQLLEDGYEVKRIRDHSEAWQVYVRMRDDIERCVDAP